jgi:hypothetical protein
LLIDWLIAWLPSSMPDNFFIPAWPIVICSARIANRLVPGSFLDLCTADHSVAALNAGPFV